MVETAILTFGKFPDIFAQFEASVIRCAPDLERVVVLDGSGVQPLDSWKVVQGVQPFTEPEFFNAGLTAVSPEKDVLYVNDDVTFLVPGCVHELRKIAHSSPKIGILSPQIDGCVGNRLQRARLDYRPLLFSKERLCFVCVYIKRAVIDAIGNMDERYTGYGGSDVDYSFRAQQAGFLLAVTTKVKVKHGFGKLRASCTFLRTMSGPEQAASMAKMDRLFKEKWTSRS